MLKKEELSFKITNNTAYRQEAILFPFAGTNNFDFNQTEAYNYFLDNDELEWIPQITLEQRPKNSSNPFSVLVLPYVQQTDISGALFFPEFMEFLNTWLQQNGYGVSAVTDAQNRKFNIWSANYEYGNFSIPVQ